jgi:hypothetical protein
MTMVRLRRSAGERIVSAMTAETALLAKLLVTAALIAATTEYAEIIRRRVLRRAAARERATLEVHGLHGLVRVFLTESPPTDAALVTVPR